MQRIRTFIWVLAAGALACGAGAAAWDLGRDGVEVKVTATPEAVDPGRDFFVTLSLTAPTGAVPELPDLRDRFRGFRVAEDFAEDPAVGADGRTTLVSRWRLVPEPCAAKYALRPFVVGDFYTQPVVFAAPPAREAVTGDMEVDPKKDFPPLSWKLVGTAALVLLGAAALVALLVLAVRKIREMVRVHKMSPIQRAYYELEKLVARGLPGRGLYKDFYVELTMVVRRYVQRKYGIKAPNLTTEEFLRQILADAQKPSAEAEGGASANAARLMSLRAFLESADLVKFAGVEATPEMADAATGTAREYLRSDSGKGVA